MADSTQISSLPGGTRPANNVVLQTREIKGAERGPAMGPPLQHGVRRAPGKGGPGLLPAGSTPGAVPSGPPGGHGGVRQLPSRHIPSVPQQYTQDEAARPNYVPPPPRSGLARDYIARHDSHAQAQRKRATERQEQEKLDSTYDELQLPVLAMVLFFLFQMPYFRRKIGQTIPSFFLKDGNPSVGGYMSLTLLFGSAFYGLTKLTKHLSEN